jgi:NADH-quinone oxidoreductase subunit I
MYGLGILRGLGITLKHFAATYIEDAKWWFKKHAPEEHFAFRQGLDTRGLFTVQYPEEKIAVPERFRYVPFLVINDHDDPEAPDHIWCTSCGICSKVCPPQCIWIVRGTDPETGRPKPEPKDFCVDIDICMNCGFCAEFCPFDAIKMDHDYEISDYERSTHIYDIVKLSKPLSYWRAIAPTRAEEEKLAREAKASAKAAAKG